MWALSRRWYQGRLDPEFRPAPVEHLQGLLTGVGLVSLFWQLR
ncbi:MAG: hypothetical protein ACR2QE_20140 [Acidimicrobiales bacterium]